MYPLHNIKQDTCFLEAGGRGAGGATALICLDRSKVLADLSEHRLVARRYILWSLLESPLLHTCLNTPNIRILYPSKLPACSV